MNIYTQGNSDNGFVTTIAITSGETVVLPMTLSTDGNPINLTGYSLKCQINFSTPLLLSTTTTGITVTNAAQGEIRLDVTSAQTASIESGSFDYDLWMTSSGGVETPLLTGKFTISPNYTPVP